MSVFDPEELILGLPAVLTGADAVAWRDYLAALWSRQTADLPSPRGLRRSAPDGLTERLAISKRWFDPVASSRKLRELVAAAPAVGDPPFGHTTATIAVGSGRRLLTPEGIAQLWLLERATADTPSPSEYPITISRSDLITAVAAVAETYRSWVQTRISGVAALLQEETSTLRPTAAGLLFFLLLNRHTAPDRPLIRPREAVRADAVNQAIGPTVMAFAHLGSNSVRASTSGFDVYRGWAYGEIARRLGSDWGENSVGVWIQPSGVAKATSRLVAASRAALPLDASTASSQLRGVTAAYDTSRPRLAALGMAFERPANTEALIAELSGTSLGSDGRA